MFWQDNPEPITTPASVVDLLFDINCKRLAVDHAYSLSQAVLGVLPWLAEEDLAGIHLIHAAPSGNGWQRPESQSEFMYLSRRAKLILRLPEDKITAAQVLNKQVLSVAEQDIIIGSAHIRPLTTTATLLAHYMVAEQEQSEHDFIANNLLNLANMGIKCSKALCGKNHYFSTPQGNILVRSLLLAELSAADSISVQQQGLGKHKLMGCGLFLPHKDLAAVVSK